MDIILIFILLTGAVLLLVGLFYLRERNQYAERFSPFNPVTDNSNTIYSSQVSYFLLQSVSKIGKLSIFKSFNTPTFNKNMAQAGWINKSAPEVFIGSMVLLDLVFLSIFVLVVMVSETAAHLLTGTPLRIFFSFLLFIYFCDACPKITLDRRKKSFVKTMVRQLPDFFELYIINITAGKSNIDALKDTLNVIQDIYPKVAQQINFLIGELQTLPSQELAWKNLSDRVDNIEIRDAIKIIRHCEVLGLPVENDLHIQTNHIRQTYLTKLEEKITRLPTTLLFPMFLFIFPSLFIVILAPALIQVMSMLK